MRVRAKSETKLPSTVQIFSSLVEMRFKPANELGVAAAARRRQKQLSSKKQIVQIYDPATMVLHADRKIETEQNRRLKFVVSLSAQHFIIGNENQIDMIGFGAIAHGYVDTDYYWSLSLKGPIDSVAVEAKRSILLILSDSTLYFYKYSIKNKELPEPVSSITLKEGVRYIRFLKETLLGIFYNLSFQVYNVQNLSLIKKKLQKNYPVDSNKKLLTIPAAIDNIINLFFEEQKQNKQSFKVWCLEVNFASQPIKTRQIYHVHDIMNYVKGKLSIQNYTKDIIFMNLNHQIMAIKNGYLIDKVNLSVNDEGEFLKYIHPETILHITKKNVEVYNFSIDFNSKPQKIVLRSTDSMEIQRYPENSFYICVLKTHKNNFAIFFEDSQKKKRQSKGQITYYFKVSQTTSIKNKIKSIFDTIGSADANPQALQQKYNMALKMGLTEKQIYLQIWNRSNRNSLEDYQYILATRDYKTIKQQIQKKLKKESMVLRQILKIQQGCHEINKQKVEALTCDQQNLQDFVSSHFLLKKLKLYKQINVLNRFSSLLSPEQNQTLEVKQLKIDVQQYYSLKNMDIKTYLIEQISDMLINLKNNAKIIRIIIKDFRFAYRLIYKKILQQIIVAAKDNLINLLNQIPEILPFIYHDLNEQQLNQGLYDGIWGQIHQREWQNSLYPQNVESLHNKEVLKQFLNSLWFKRYQLTTHEMTPKSKKEIININQLNNSDKIFYFFISKLYDNCKSNKPLYYQTVHFLQQKYQLFPAHLKHKSLLYENLYIYYFSQQKNTPGRLNFADFLEWDDELLFKYFFDHQKIKKGSLLKQVKPIYQQSDVNGSHIFNIGLFSYFYSNRSEISDLKFILNRINNEKAQFHQKNHGIYEVLIKSMQLKLKIGSDHDIPIDEVMIYIQNIPLDSEEGIMGELNVMENIKQQAGLFRQMRINMTVKDIMDNFQTVLYKILKYKIQKEAIMTIKQWNLFREKSIVILKQAERIKNKIYNLEHSTYTLLVYLSIIMQKEQYIEKIAGLLQDQQIHSIFDVQVKTIQNIVIYMYKWKFSQSARYNHNASYLRKLLELLPNDNECRIYLQTQLQLGLILSSDAQPFEYPIQQHVYCPTIKVIQQVFKIQNSQYLLSIDIKRLHELIQNLDNAVYMQGKKASEPITLHKLYEILIVQLLEKQLYRQVIEYLYCILQIQSPIKNIAVIYIALYIYKMAKQFNEQSKKCIFKLFALYFKEPKTMLKVIDNVIKTQLTGLQQSKYLKQILQKQQASKINFNYHNNILSKDFTSHSQDPNTKKVIQVYRQYLKTKSEQYQRSSQYDIIFTILCHAPYLLMKFIQLQKHHLHIRDINYFIRATIQRPIFNLKKSNEVLKRVFASLIMSSKQSKDIDYYLGLFLLKSTEEEFQLPKFNKLNGFQTKMFKIAKFYAKTIKRKKTVTQQQMSQKKIIQIKALISNPNLVLREHLQIQQSDQQAGPTLTSQQQNSKKKKHKQGRIQFDEAQEKRLVFFRTENIKQFLQNKNKARRDTKQIQNAKKQSPPSMVAGKLGGKDTNYLAIRNNMIQHLYSHKVVIGSQYQDDPNSRKEDEQFLDNFSPNLRLNNSQSSVRSSRRSIRNSRNSRIQQRSIIEPQNNQLQKIKLFDKQFLDTENNNEANYESILHKDPQSEDQKLESLRQILIKSYNQTKIPKFQISPIQNEIKAIQEQNKSSEQSEIIQKKQTYLRKFFNYLYNQPPQTININLKLIEEISRKQTSAGVNIFFLQAYQRTFATHEKHGLQMNMTQILPISGIYIKSKDIIDLYHQIQPFLNTKINDQNVLKLSKLIALGFRKSVVEQQILFNYFKCLVKQFVIQEGDTTAIKQKLRGILQKIQVQIAIDKGQQLFRQIEPGERREFLLQSYTQSIKNKGYQSAARELLSKVS